MLQKLMRKRFEELSVHLSGRQPKRESSPGEFMVPPPDEDSEAGRCEAIFNFEILGNSMSFCECSVV